MNKIGTIENKNILFLQGPIGFFFKNLDNSFRKKGAKTYKITLNTADWFFSNYDNTFPFKGERVEWYQFIANFLKEKKIDKIFLFGDCRFYQRHAISIALELKIDVFVFEEGYLRPDFITMERYGVNNFSKVSREKNFYESLNNSYLQTPIVQPVNPSYRRMAFSAISYYLIAHFFKWRYPHYIHHREPSAIKEFFWWWRNIFRKVKYYFLEKGLSTKLSNELSKKYYFVPLQTHNDFQLIEHSGFNFIEDFITTVIDSFAHFAPKNSYLVIKHHPADRGRRNYKNFIFEKAQAHHILDRILVVHDLHLPTCLKHAKGTVTINSTVGLSSIGHKTATITLGNAIYDIEGLTCKGMLLDEFWKNAKTPNNTLYLKFKNYLIATTQLNGSYYGLFPLEFKNDEMYKQ